MTEAVFLHSPNDVQKETTRIRTIVSTALDDVHKGSALARAEVIAHLAEVYYKLLGLELNIVRERVREAAEMHERKDRNRGGISTEMADEYARRLDT